MKIMSIKIVCVVLFTILSNFTTAQYRDNNNIYFYVECYRNGHVVNDPQVLVLYINGSSCGTFYGNSSNSIYAVSREQVYKDLITKERYFEDKISELHFRFKLSPNMSSDSWDVYNWYKGSFSDYYLCFSKDRKTFKWVTLSDTNPKDERVFLRVDKSYFINSKKQLLNLD